MTFSRAFLEELEKIGVSLAPKLLPNIKQLASNFMGAKLRKPVYNPRAKGTLPRAWRAPFSRK